MGLFDVDLLENLILLAAASTGVHKGYGVPLLRLRIFIFSL